MVDTYGKKVKSILFILVIMFIGEIKHRDYFFISNTYFSTTAANQELAYFKHVHNLHCDHS